MRTLDPIRVQPVAGESLTALLQKYAERVRRQGKNQAQIARDAGSTRATCRGSSQESESTQAATL